MTRQPPDTESTEEFNAKLPTSFAPTSNWPASVRRKVIERADDELDEYLRAYYGQPLDVMRHGQAIRGGSVAECLD